MKPFLQLNLNSPSDNDQSTNLPQPDRVEQDPAAVSKKLNEIANRAAHKGAAHYGRSSSGIFSK